MACVNVSLTPDLRQQLEDAISLEGKVLAQAPVQITDVIEKPGSLLVQWAEEVITLPIYSFYNPIHKLGLSMISQELFFLLLKINSNFNISHKLNLGK